jgi:hypothetical protein
MFPTTASTDPNEASSSSAPAETMSPAWRTRSASSSSRMHLRGSRRAPRGRCVSEMTATSASVGYLRFGLALALFAFARFGFARFGFAFFGVVTRKGLLTSTFVRVAFISACRSTAIT